MGIFYKNFVFLGLGVPRTDIVDIGVLLNTTEAYSNPCQRSKMELFAKIVKGCLRGSEYAYIPQPAITCSKLTVETLEQGVNFDHI